MSERPQAVPLPPPGPDRDALCMLACGYERVDGKWVSRAGPNAKIVPPGSVLMSGFDTIPISRDDKWALLFFEQVVEMVGAGNIGADMEDARGQGFIVHVAFMCGTCGGSVNYVSTFADAVTAAGLLALGYCHTDGVTCRTC